MLAEGRPAAGGGAINWGPRRVRWVAAAGSAHAFV